MWEDVHDLFDIVNCFPVSRGLREGFGRGGGCGSVLRSFQSGGDPSRALIYTRADAD